MGALPAPSSTARPPRSRTYFWFCHPRSTRRARAVNVHQIHPIRILYSSLSHPCRSFSLLVRSRAACACSGDAAVARRGRVRPRDHVTASWPRPRDCPLRDVRRPLPSSRWLMAPPPSSSPFRVRLAPATPRHARAHSSPPSHMLSRCPGTSEQCSPAAGGALCVRTRRFSFCSCHRRNDH